MIINNKQIDEVLELLKSGKDIYEIPGLDDIEVSSLSNEKMVYYKFVFGSQKWIVGIDKSLQIW